MARILKIPHIKLAQEIRATIVECKETKVLLEGEYDYTDRINPIVLEAEIKVENQGWKKATQKELDQINNDQSLVNKLMIDAIEKEDSKLIETTITLGVD